MRADIYLLINNTWTIQDWIYPIVLNKTLDESLDNGAFTIYGSTQKALFPNFTKCKIVLSDMPGETVTYTETRYFYANDDVKQSKFIPPYTYNHTITLIEPTKILEKYIICGQGTSQPIADEKPIKYIDEEIDRLLETNPTRRTTDAQLFVLDESLRTKLHIKSPEFRWTCKMTLFECLHEVGKYIGAMPRLIPNSTDDKLFNTVTFEQFGNIEDTIADLEFSGYAIEQDENQYCTELETYVENCIEDGDTIVTYPAIGAWITARSDELAPTEENLYIPTPTPIERIKKVLVKNVKTRVWSSVTGNDYTGIITNPSALDITRYIVTEDEWKTLPINGGGVLDKDCTFYYEQGKKNIPILAKDYGNVFTGVRKPYGGIINSAAGNNVTITDSNGQMWVGDLTAADVIISQNLKDWQFQIEYIPISSGKAKAVKQIL